MNNLNAKIKKAVIPVAGLGTRMLPATKAIPKEMLPLVDKPLIQYIVSECIISGITEIIFITHSSKNSIENHFDTNFELETILQKRVNYKLLEEIQSIYPNNITIIQIRQKIKKGLGHAIFCAYPVIGNEPIVVILPDVILDRYQCDLSHDNLTEMIKRFDETGHSQIMVELVKDVTAYGIVDCKGIILKPGESTRITAIVEKPQANLAPSHLAVIGRYVFSAKIWSLLSTTSYASDEIQFTEAINKLIKKEIVEAYYVIGKSYDCGNKLGYMQAFVKYGMYHSLFGKEFRSWLQKIVNDKN